jgi:hypothetical protein
VRVLEQQGEPICDYFEVELFEEGRTLVCIADGCSWGEQPRQAARKATDAYMGYLRDNQRSITDLRDAGRLILRAFQKAHIKILEGTTTRPTTPHTTQHNTTQHNTTQHNTTQHVLGRWNLRRGGRT